MDIKINPETGDLAIPQAGGSYRVYKKGEYKFDPDTGKYAVPNASGGWKVYQHEKKGSFLPMSQDIEGNLNFDITAGFPGAIISGITAPGDVASGKLDPNSPEGMSRAIDTAALMVGVNPLVASGERAIPGARKALKPERPKVPTAQELKAAAGEGFKRAEGMGVDYSSESIKSLGDDIAQQLERKSIREKRAPDTFDILNEIRNPPADSVVSLVGLREIRAAFNDITGDFGAATTKTDRKAAQDAIRAIDQFLEEPPLASVMDRTGVGDGGTAIATAGPETFSEAVAQLRSKQQNAADAGAAIKEANANYAAAEHSANIAGKLEKAELDAAAAHSGLNLDNRTRQILKAIIDPERPRNRRGFSREELAVIEQIVRGNPGTNVARYLGNLLGGGGGVMSFLPGGAGALAGSMFGPWGAAAGAAIPPALGLSLRTLAGKLTQRGGAKLEKMIRKRSPLYQGLLANPKMVPISPELRLAPVRGLIMQQEPKDEGLRYRPR